MMSKNKKLTSLPSTRHQQFYLSTSQSTPQIRIFKSQLNQILQSMKEILKFRIHLQKKDMQHIYKKQQTTLQEIWQCSSFQYFWDHIDKDKDQVLNEKQQLSMLSTILVWINTKKLQFADNKMYFQFTEMKALLEQFQCLVIQYEGHLRQYKKIKILTKNKNSKAIKQKILQQNQKQILQEVQRDHQIIKEQKNINDESQRNRLQEQLIIERENISNKYRPSLTLSQTKNISLLAKLAPYKNEKKRQYECLQLQKMIDDGIQSDDVRKMREIEQFKKLQRKKLHNRQKIQNESLQMRLKIKLDKTVCLLRQDQKRFQNSERIKAYKIQTKTQISSNQRLNWIRNSLNAYTQRQETKKISQIIRNHQHSTQFENDIHLISQGNGQKNSPRYSTINLQRTSRRQRSNSEYERHLLRKIKIQQFDNEEQNSLQRNKSSLADLYNMDLTLK